MDADQPVGMGDGELHADRRPPIATLGGEPVVAQRRHQRGKAVGHLGDAEAALSGLEGQAVAGQGRGDDGERVGRIAAEPRRVGQARDDVEELEHRPRPAMQQQQLLRRRTAPRHVQEVQADAGDVQLVLGKRVQRRFLRAPVEADPPVIDQATQIIHVGAVGPGRVRRLIGEAGAAQPILQVGDRRIGDAEGVGSRRHGVLLRWLCARTPGGRAIRLGVRCPVGRSGCGRRGSAGYARRGGNRDHWSAPAISPGRARRGR